MFGRKKSSLLGIDISPSVVKILELGKKGDKYSVESYALEPLPAGAIVEDRIEKGNEVAGAIKIAVKRSGTKAKEAAIAVSGNGVITKTVSFPAGLSSRELEENVTLQAENHIPFPLDEVRLDFEVLGTSVSDAEAVDVLIAASRRENVDARTEIVEQAGLTPKIVDIEAYTVENAFKFVANGLPGRGEDLTVAVADVGTTVTTLYVLVNGKIIFTREQAFGGQMLPDDIEQYYGLSYQKANNIQEDVGSLDDYEPEVLEPFKNAMTMTVTRALQFFFSASTQYQSIDHIILAGVCSSIRGLSEMIEDQTGTSTSIANPFSEMVLGPRVKIQALSNDAPSMMIACGLAMRSFD